MRKANKNNLFEITKTLCDAHKAAQSYMENDDKDMAIGLLTECQNAAIGMGENIEVSEGEGVPTIALLQEYCETLYQVAVVAEEGGETTSCFGTLDVALKRIEHSIEEDIRVCREVVFLPYKASMWDSLESVWKAAVADPNCDVYVVPIPYYDKNPNGSFKKIHYEGGQFPVDVPVVWYEDYDFAARRPDVIFIHNPYDECNYVTSVAPFFYSKNLKQYTDKLVYIPYFVLGEINPKDDTAVERVSHFCTVPGVINADKVIVQSENMREAYIRVLTDFAGFQSKGYWEEKILGLGSPKLDKVGQTKKDELLLPKEWEAIIKKQDGTWKKVVLYNTSITAMLKKQEQMLRKIKDVFHVFRERKDEVVLFWRPHPLMQATIESMCPKLWKEYSELVEEYITEGFGVYDDTPDLNRAITMSDAYYGDPSSLVQLCKRVNIPIMIQSTEILDSKEICLYAEGIKFENPLFEEELLNLRMFLPLVCGIEGKKSTIVEKCGEVIWKGLRD